MNMKQLEARVEELESQVVAAVIDLHQRLEALEQQVTRLPVRDRGPDSQRRMSEEDAFRVCYGDLRQVSVKDACMRLGLSYGQVYSAREQYTFVRLHDAMQKDPKATAAKYAA